VKTDLSINGRPHTINHEPGATLLETLRGDLGLKGSKPGCGRGECGACTVLIDGRPRMSCITLTALTAGTKVETIEGLAAETAPLREAFADEGGFQCGYCTPGQVVAAHALLAEGTAVGAARAAMSGNICRCTGYGPIIAAIERTAEQAGPGA
jgi:aerobic-type carbon monoxide dehydrogenase small subunit (CoxS/CutS family)